MPRSYNPSATARGGRAGGGNRRSAAETLSSCDGTRAINAGVPRSSTFLARVTLPGETWACSAAPPIVKGTHMIPLPLAPLERRKSGGDQRAIRGREVPAGKVRRKDEGQCLALVALELLGTRSACRFRSRLRHRCQPSSTRPSYMVTGMPQTVFCDVGTQLRELLRRPSRGTGR